MGGSSNGSNPTHKLLLGSSIKNPALEREREREREREVMINGKENKLMWRIGGKRWEREEEEERWD